MAEKYIPLAAVESGDLLIWSEDPYSNFSDLCLKVIRFVTRSPYGHVGVAWRFHDGLNDELFVVEATLPKIRIARLTTDMPFYCVPMRMPVTQRGKDFLMSKIGYTYSFADAIRGALGLKVEHDMKWQCAEFAHGYYEALGLRLREEYTPGKIVKNATEIAKTDVYRVIGPGRTIDIQGA